MSLVLKKPLHKTHADTHDVSAATVTRGPSGSAQIVEENPIRND